MKMILNLPMQDNDADADTIRDYLFSLLMSVWEQNEGFSGKRPFGNSCWELELFQPLVKYGIISGQYDEDGDFECNEREGHKIIRRCIEQVFYGN